MDGEPQNQVELDPPSLPFHSPSSPPQSITASEKKKRKNCKEIWGNKPKYKNQVHKKNYKIGLTFEKSVAE